MQRLKRFFALFLSSAIVLGLLSSPVLADDSPLAVSYLTLSPGSNATHLNFSWHTTAQASAPVVRIWQGDGAAAEFTGTSSSSASTLSTMYYNRVTVTGLESDTTYTYQLGNGSGDWSVEYTTTTGNPDTFSYLVFGDPQVSSQTYGNNWKNTLELALALRPDLAFMASTGDNIDSNTTAQYNYFFTPSAIFSSLPLATCMGNHEGSGTTPHAFYNPPNADSAQNYWYRYGDTLFMVWNCTTGNAAGMRSFLAEAISSNEDATWRILNFHYDVYGQGTQHALSDGKTYRDNYVRVIDEFDIDVVFNGHDHSYSRSYPMIWSGSSTTSNSQGMQPETFGPDGESIDPTGTVYFSLNSASGQKYYSLAAKQAYTASMWQQNRPMFSIVDMTANTFTCTTYQVNTDNSLTEVDSYTIVKTVPVELTLATNKPVVHPDEYFNVSVSFPGEMESNLIKLSFTFDADNFEFAGYTPADGATLLTREYGAGYATVMVMVNDYGMESLGDLMLKAKDDTKVGSSEVAATALFVERDGNLDKAVREGKGSYNQTTSNAGTPEFVIDMIVLSNLIDAFGMTSADPGWDLYSHFDYNGNGVIDISDIVTVAQMIK